MIKIYTTYVVVLLMEPATETSFHCCAVPGWVGVRNKSVQDLMIGTVGRRPLHPRAQFIDRSADHAPRGLKEQMKLAEHVSLLHRSI